MLIEQRYAADTLRRVLDGRSLTATLETLLRRHPEIDAAQRGAIWDVTHGSLRMLALLRALLAQMAHKPLSDPELEALLLVALFQLAYTRAAAYAVVDAAVNNAAALGRPWAKGLCNALLRRFLRERDALLAAARATDVGRYSYPQWWIDRVRRAYPREWMEVLEAGNRRAPLVLRVNRRKIARDEYLRRLAGAGIDARAVGTVGVELLASANVASLPGFAQGEASVQDAGAQRAAEYLDVHAGQRVLDACAAPGGKTAHILECADVDLVALDNDPERVKRIDDTLRRLGLHARIVCADAAALDACWDGRTFDRVLLDVPCTASGIVRRHPDIKWLRRESDIAALAERAAALLEALWRVLAPGGKLLFATCSVFPEENGAQIDDFVGRHADARLAPLPGQDGSDVQLLPDDSHDGFYYALLERR